MGLFTLALTRRTRSLSTGDWRRRKEPYPRSSSISSRRASSMQQYASLRRRCSAILICCVKTHACMYSGPRCISGEPSGTCPAGPDLAHPRGISMRARDGHNYSHLQVATLPHHLRRNSMSPAHRVRELVYHTQRQCTSAVDIHVLITTREASW